MIRADPVKIDVSDHLLVSGKWKGQALNGKGYLAVIAMLFYEC